MIFALTSVFGLAQSGDVFAAGGSVVAPQAAPTKLAPNAKTANRSAAEVLAIYTQATNAQASFSGTLFATAPQYVGGYVPGELSTSARDSVLGQVKAYRNLVGLNYENITIEEAEMPNSQHCSNALAQIGQLAHSFTPDQQTAITAVLGASNYISASTMAGKSNLAAAMSSNGSSSLYRSGVVTRIKSWIDDTSNISTSMPVGHRTEIFSSRTQRIYFGSSDIVYIDNWYSIFSSIGSAGSETTNTEKYYAWPSEGYFPILAINEGQRWNIQVTGASSANSGSNPTVTLSFKNQTVAAESVLPETRGSEYVVSFKLPDSIRNAVAGSSSAYDNAGHADVTVRINGIKDASSSDVYAEYTVKLFKEVPVPITGVTINEGSAASLTAGGTKQLSVGFQPANTTDAKTVNWTSSNAKVASVSTNGLVTATGAGTATITATSAARPLLTA
ncbi:MAG: Ig-like domain-containing protein, partial [Clostridiales Family XIII bacterium]|nr:Ig-like domain-containing protein [Clostridiales Family XIII bacterium]